MNLRRSLLSVFLCATLPASAVTWIESVDGDLSGDYLNPTPLVLGVGSNLLSGTLAGGETDLDLFTLVVAPGQEVAEIRVIEFSGGGTQGSFLGLQPGMMLSHSPIPSSSFGGNIGFVIITPGQAATDADVLPNIAQFGPYAGSTSLPAGMHAGWLNENTSGSSYTLDFVVIPEPGSSLLALAGLSVLLFRRRRS